MDEDLSFYRIVKEQEADQTTEALIAEFKETFRGTKTTLMNFLTQYKHPEALLDDKFFTTFNMLVGILAERIAFEEKNLYIQLNLK